MEGVLGLQDCQCSCYWCCPRHHGRDCGYGNRHGGDTVTVMVGHGILFSSGGAGVMSVGVAGFAGEESSVLVSCCLARLLDCSFVCPLVSTPCSLRPDAHMLGDPHHRVAFVPAANML